MKVFKLSYPASLEFSNQDIIVTDPCYFIPDDIWDKLCDEWFPKEKLNETDYADLGIIVFDNGAKVLYSSTANGDGTYPIYVRRGAGTSVHNNHTSVDAGTIAVVSIKDLRKIEKDYGAKDGKAFDIDDIWYPRINNFSGRIFADGIGNFQGDLECTTISEMSEEDNYYEDWNEESDDPGFDQYH
jgi:hypothetical protein